MLPTLLPTVFFVATDLVADGLLHCHQPCWRQTPFIATDPVADSLIHHCSGSASSSVLPMLQSDSLLSNFCGGWCRCLRYPVCSKLPWQLVPLNIAAEVALDGLFP